MHGKNAELKGHPDKTYKFVYYCGCPGIHVNGTLVKKLTHKKERREIKQLLHLITQQTDINEEAWTKILDSC